MVVGLACLDRGVVTEEYPARDTKNVVKLAYEGLGGNGANLRCPEALEARDP